jgi:hypothetical protein
MSRFDLGLLVSYRPLAINSALASVRLLLPLRLFSSREAHHNCSSHRWSIAASGKGICRCAAGVQ